jgi:hypothetical protein
MKLDPSAIDRILEAVTKAPGCRLEDLVSLFPGLTRNQVFCEVKRLSQNHHLFLILDNQGSFIVSPPA